MAAKSYALEFAGYWREQNISGIPGKSGVYCVYACKYDPRAKQVWLHRLIYIGEADNVRQRVAGHEKRDDWRDHLNRGEELCFSFASVQSSDRQRVEAAMIFHHKPPVNEEYKHSFPFDSTTISTSGCNALLDEHFTVFRTP